MEPGKLKSEFGRDEVRKNVEIFMKGGGYVFSQVHNIQAGIPPENILAMCDEVNRIEY
jgi:uroporphyrinogen decarboxylase